MREREALIEAKNGSKQAAEEIINMYKPLVYKFSLNYFVIGYTDEDLRQIGFRSILNAIKMYDMERGVNFAAYIKITIINNFNVLVRDAKKLQGVGSLNLVNEEGFELMDLIESDENIEEEIIDKENIIELQKALNKLSKEEREYILFINQKNSGTITEYSKLTGVNYKKCIRMRDSIMKKLRKDILK